MFKNSSILRLALIVCAQLWLAKIAKGQSGGGAAAADGGICEEFAHLSLCQLRQQLGQIEQLLDMAIGEIDFLADGEVAAAAADVGASMPAGSVEEAENENDSPSTASSPQKRATTVRSLAGAPLLVRLASRGGGSQQSGGSSKSAAGAKIIRGAGGPGILLSGGGPLRQSASGSQPRASTTYRLIRLPAGAKSPLLNMAAGRGVSTSSGGGIGGQQGQGKAMANQLLRQLWT